jgi:membrane protein DedA with SNARE-associated domain
VKKLMAVVGWALRASALICVVWIFGQVISGQMTTVGAIVNSVVWHAAFALSGVALVGASRERVEGGEAAAA